MKRKITVLLVAISLIIGWQMIKNPVAAAGEPLRIKETALSYTSLSEAFTALNANGGGTLEILADITVENDLKITVDTKLISSGGDHRITLGNNKIIVENDARLTLGDSTITDLLTINANRQAIVVNAGSIITNDGVALFSSGNSSTGTLIKLEGPQAKGDFYGGYFEAYQTLVIVKGAQVNEISGGSYNAKATALFVSDAGSRVNKISGGSFIKIDQNIDRSTVYVDSSAIIDEISDGYFAGNGPTSNALLIIRGGWVNKISGGEFVSLLYGEANATLMVWADGYHSGIGEISGGYFHGGLIALWLYEAEATVTRISGGAFEATRALQLQAGATIGEIKNASLHGDTYGIFNYDGKINIIGPQTEVKGDSSSGLYNYGSRSSVTAIDSANFYGGNFGIVNQGNITSIGGDTSIIGDNSAGIYNYTNATIGEINNGNIACGPNGTSAIRNRGTITLIAGGTFVGEDYAINNLDSANASEYGKLNVVTAGLFLGKKEFAFNLAYSLLLEPDLSAIKGLGFYWGKAGQIFNDETLVTYPADYWMSEETRSNVAFPAFVFRYLTRENQEPEAAELHKVTIIGSYVAPNGSGEYLPGDTVIIVAGNRDNYQFSGWLFDADVEVSERANKTTSFIMPNHDVTFTATWNYVGLTTAPNTGDSFPWQLWSLLIVALIAFGLSFMKGKRNK